MSAATHRPARRSAARRKAPAGLRTAAGRSGDAARAAPSGPSWSAWCWPWSGAASSTSPTATPRSPTANRAFEAQSTYVTYSGGKQRIGTFAEQNRESIPLADIPQSMQDAVIAAEDRTFYSNSGIDPKGILRAAFSNARGNATQGASTITQQYVKLLYLSQERTLGRKVKEAFLSLKVQQESSKEAILEGYLNTIYFGRGAYGVQAASRAFFGKPARLTVQESATLAAVLNSPAGSRPTAATRPGSGWSRATTTCSPAWSSWHARRRRGRPARRQAARSSSSAAAATSSAASAASCCPWSRTSCSAWASTRPRSTPAACGSRPPSPARRMAANAEGVAERRPEGLKGLHVASASVDVQTGALIGFFAGQDYLRQPARLGHARRLAGLVLQAVRARRRASTPGFSLRDTFDGNSPYEFDDGSGSVDNQGEGTGTNFGSAISLVTATENSVNTAYADLTDSIPDGPRKIREMAVAPRASPTTPRAWSPTTRSRSGSATVSPVSMANAYATIANGGVAHDVFTVKRVTRAERRRGALQGPAQDRAGALRGHRQRRQLRHAAGGGQPAAAPTPRAWAVPRPARPAPPPTPTATCRRRGSWATPRRSPPR